MMWFLLGLSLGVLAGFAAGEAFGRKVGARLERENREIDDYNWRMATQADRAQVWRENHD